MGYAVHHISSRFTIPASNMDAAFESLKALRGRETCGTSGEKHFMWLGDSSGFLNSNSLEQALHVWRWPAVLDDDGGIAELEFRGENLGDEELLFSTIAPYVAAGSFIIMVGEDGVIWRWYFSEGAVSRQTGNLSFGD